MLFVHENLAIGTSCPFRSHHEIARRLEYLAVVNITLDNHIPLVEEDLTESEQRSSWRSTPLGSLRIAAEKDVVRTIGDEAEAVDRKRFIVVVAPICVMVASAVQINVDGADRRAKLTYKWPTAQSMRHDHKQRGLAASQAFPEPCEGNQYLL
jgi:hypothetical protein